MVPPELRRVLVAMPCQGLGRFASPNHRPGVEMEVTAPAMPFLAIASSERSGDHSGVRPETVSGPMRASPTAATYCGGRM